jgi:tetratricopeptide (TPR) repeat protein
LGSLHLRRGEVARAITVLERALELCRTWDTQLRLWFLGVAPSLAHAYALSGKAPQAIALLESAIEQAAARKMMFAQPLRMGWLAHAYAKVGRVADADRVASEALDLARRHGERGHEVWIQGIAGEVAEHGDPLDAARAERAYRTAIEVGDELGMRPRVALCQLGLGRLYRRTGRPADARRHLEAALAFLRPSAMELWLREAEAELAAIG